MLKAFSKTCNPVNNPHTEIYQLAYPSVITNARKLWKVSSSRTRGEACNALKQTQNRTQKRTPN